MSTTPEDLTDDDLLNLLTDEQLAELDNSIAETFGTEGLDKADPKIGVGLLAWSVKDRYLLARNDNMPQALWIWDTQKLQLCALLQQLDAVRCAAWDPVRTRLVNNLLVGPGLLEGGDAAGGNLNGALVNPQDLDFRPAPTNVSVAAPPAALAPKAQFTLPEGTRPLRPPRRWLPGALQPARGLP